MIKKTELRTEKTERGQSGAQFEATGMNEVTGEMNNSSGQESSGDLAREKINESQQKRKKFHTK